MNPYSLVTYYRRHKCWSVMLIALMALAVMGVYLLFSLFQESYITPDYTINRYLSKFNLVQPDHSSSPDMAVADLIRAYPDVAQVLPQRNVEIAVPNVGGLYFFFRLLGLKDTDVNTVLTQSDVTVIEGHLPQPDTNGVALSKEIASSLGLVIGDTFDSSLDDGSAFDSYTNIVSPLEVVGILSGDVRMGIMSFEFLDKHESYHDLTRSGMLIIAKPGRESSVDDFLQNSIQNSSIEVYTLNLMEEAAAKAQRMLLTLFIPIMLLVTAAITLVIGAINQLAFTRRLPEFGTLYAVGRSKAWLVRRLALETGGLAVVGWVLGTITSWLGLAILSHIVYGPKGFPFSPFQLTALWLVVPLPLAVMGVTLFRVARALHRLDAVAIVERGELSLEGDHGKSSARVQAGSLPRPLAATTFYRRHTRRAVTLISAMALMIVGTALMVFVVESVFISGQPSYNYLRWASMVYPDGRPLDTAAIAKIRTHLTVERVIPVVPISPLALALPLMKDSTPLDTYAVSAEDMNYLVGIYGLVLADGHLPRPGTNELVIPWTAAKNRSLHVGDVVGDGEHPIYPDAPALPYPLVVSGIFASSAKPDKEVWLSFMSLDFLENSSGDWKPDTALIIVPSPGNKPALDAWLEQQFNKDGSGVLTYDNQQAWINEALNTGLFTVSLMETIIALVAALALSGLNYIFVTQRQAEFGVLYALGFSRLHLVWRVVHETLLTTGIAWFMGLLGCVAIMALLQYQLYTPSGLRLNYLNLTPWLYTLPIPIAVLVVGAGAIGWALSRLDPVAVIERRV